MLISITGINGAGKTTQAKLLVNNLNKSGVISFFSEAYGSLEYRIFDKYFQRCNPKTITLIFQGLFCEQCEKAKIELNNNKIVVAAGWNESFIAHHSQFGYLSKENSLRKMLNQMAFDNIEPDITFFLDISVIEATERMAKRGDSFFDKQGIGYYRAMSRYYNKMSKKRKRIVIDGKQEIKKIHKIIISHVLKIFNNNGTRR